ncbi:hypothetical protein TWF694_001652 [Orbilia ellipsospora]|uniref:Shugoshin C-terminal domain-containing protein n=1 Tax=Orbilia ellipsospora TaxID=2528407 RepID=A0AAV9X999_9PEZI
MAKLSDVNQNAGFDTLEALKRRYQRQNRELARVNATQAQQIAALQAEVAQQNAENIRLNAENIHLQRQLDGRGSGSSSGVAESTKKLLQEKLAQLSEIVRGIDGAVAGPGRITDIKTRLPTAVRPSPRERPEGFLSDIPENRATGSENRLAGQISKNPLFPAAAKRVEMRLEAEAQAQVQARSESPSKNYIPLDPAMFDIRPRRRRDSAVENLLMETDKLEKLVMDARDEVSKTETAKIFAKEPTKRKYPAIAEPVADENKDRLIPPRLGDIEEILSSPVIGVEEPAPPRGPGNIKENKHSDVEVAPKKLIHNVRDTNPMIKTTTEAVLGSRQGSEATEDVVPAKIPEYLETGIDTRGILEPKSNNPVAITVSPVRVPTTADFEYVKKEKLSPKARDPVKKSSKLAKPIIVQGVENTMTPEKGVERNRRSTRGVTVNYALPALNKKMRRESETLVDAVTGIQQPKRRASTAEDSKESSAATTPAATPLEGDKKSLKTGLEDIERKTSKMSIHPDARTETQQAEKRSSSTGERISMTDRDIRKLIVDKMAKERDARLEEARKDIYAFTSSSSPDATESNRRSSTERLSLSGTGVTSGSHQRRTSGGITTIGIGSGVRKEGEAKTSTSTNTSVKSASDLLEERRRRRASLGGSGAMSSFLPADGKSRKSVDFAQSVTERERASSGKEGRRRSMVI